VKLGLIGLGIMGKPIAKILIKASYYKRLVKTEFGA
jgi:3-hydroxyisobutyrate dehydrogenase-like beta-hydroxyacid dehydrogenase